MAFVGFVKDHLELTPYSQFKAPRHQSNDMCRYLNQLWFAFMVILFCGCTPRSRHRHDEGIHPSKEKFHSKRNQTTKDSFSGRVVGVLDGDTYDVLSSENEQIRIRMEGIDAPERGMPYYKASKKHLSQLCFKKDVRVEISTTDRYGRTIGYGYLEDGRELGHEMLKAGLAWHYKKYNSDRDMSRLEADARKSRVGLWKDERPMAPWDNRRYHRNGISTKDSFDIKN